MATGFRWLSVFLFALLGAFYIAFGAVYATVKDLLWFHAAATECASQDIKPLYFALMTLIGGASIGLGVIGSFVALTQIRRAETPAAFALFFAYVIPLIFAAITAERLARQTGSPTSWHLMGILVAIATLGLLAHLFGARSKSK